MSLAVLQGGSAIDAGSTVIKGVSYEAFLHLAFDATTTPTVSAADISTQRGGVTSYYFLSNGVNPKGVTVPFGSTGYNLFRFTISTNSIEYLASGSAFTVTAVPAPGAAALLVLGALAGRRRRA
jgi:MYXO-CTERM domain-containing protein